MSMVLHGSSKFMLVNLTISVGVNIVETFINSGVGLFSILLWDVSINASMGFGF
jgi:hypothetical protein